MLCSSTKAWSESLNTCTTLQVELAVNNNESAARIVKAKIEKTVLGQVAAHIKAVLQPNAGFVSICLDLGAINRLQLIINPRSVALALLKHSKLKLKADNIRCTHASITLLCSMAKQLYTR